MSESLECPTRGGEQATFIRTAGTHRRRCRDEGATSLRGRPRSAAIVCSLPRIWCRAEASVPAEWRPCIGWSSSCGSPSSTKLDAAGINLHFANGPRGVGGPERTHLAPAAREHGRTFRARNDAAIDCRARSSSTQSCIAATRILYPIRLCVLAMLAMPGAKSAMKILQYSEMWLKFRRQVATGLSRGYGNLRRRSSKPAHLPRVEVS